MISTLHLVGPLKPSPYELKCPLYLLPKPLNMIPESLEKVGYRSFWSTFDIWPKNTVRLISHLFVMSLHITLQSYIFVEATLFWIGPLEQNFRDAPSPFYPSFPHPPPSFIPFFLTNLFPNL